MSLPPGLDPLALRHRELEVLFQADIRISPVALTQILALPRESLLADLHHVLEQAAPWINPFQAAGHQAAPILPPDRSFILHVLNLLAEIRDPGSLPRILDFARLPKESLHFWLGKFLDDSLWEMLYHFVRDDFSALGPFLRKNAPALPVKIAVLDCVAQIAWQQPVKRLAVFDWHREVMADVLAGKLELESELLGWLVRNALDLRATGLLDLIRKLYAAHDVHEGVAGDLETLEKEMEWPVRSWTKRQVFNLQDRYAYLVATLYPSTPEEKDTAVKMHRVKPPKPGKGNLRVMGRKKTPLRKGKKVGRNDPCPCGSGKKYKKCHGA